jgi:hypothetical protein
LFLLKQLINDQLSYLKHKSKNAESNISHVTIPEEDFIDRVSFFFCLFFFKENLIFCFSLKARQLKITNVKSFYECDLFKTMKYQYDSAKKTISQNL